jgi:peroxiredoxin
MKKFILIAAFFAPAMLKAQTINYAVKGSIGKLDAPAKAYLVYRTETATVTDSVNIQQGNFAFAGTYTSPVKATLIISHDGETLKKLKKADQLPVYLETATIKVTAADSIAKATISGSPLNKDNQELTQVTKPYTQQINALETAYMALPKDQRTDEAEDALEKKADAIEDAQKPVLADFIKKHPNSLISLNALQTYGGYFPEASLVAPLYDGLSAELKNGVAGVQYGKLLQAWKSIALGANAPLFTQNDKDGKAVTLASFKGKYVLVDFWASWCGPCRHDNPGIVKTFNQYKDKNFTILGVSLDSKRDPWLKAIDDDKLTWTQVSDLKYWKNEVAELYGVRAIPQNFLLDPNGNIVAKNLNGDALAAKLSQIFNVSGGAGKAAKAADSK